MALVMTQEGALRMLSWLLQLASPAVPTLHLLGTAYVPHETSLLSQLAANEVAGVGGYGPLTVGAPKSVWSAVEFTPGAQATSSFFSWTFTGAVTVFGYYVSDDSFNVSLWAEQFAASFPFSSGGGVLSLQLAVFLENVPGVS